MVKKISLDNNIPVLLETAREVHSLCIGIWVKVGSRNEESAENGISHFVEHMLFKGTEKRSAEDIAMEIDSLGGELNAFTSSEYTLFYIKVLNEYMENSVDLLTDIFLNSTLPGSELEKEKSIIREEIKMVEDTPTDYVFEIFSQNIWGDTGLGQSILGKEETIETFTRDHLISHMEKFYGTENIIVACSGSFNEDRLVEHLNRSVGRLKRKGEKKHELLPNFMGSLHAATKDLSEAHICLGIKGMKYNHEDRYSMHLLNTVLGSGFSSRLFQNVREKRGLVYSIYSYHASYFDTGLWTVYAGTDRKHVAEVIDLTVNEIKNLSRTMTENELQRAKAQLKGNLILALESTSNKMTNIAKQEIYYGRYFSPGEIIRMVEDITLEHVKDLAMRLVNKTPFALTVYGPVKESDLRDSYRLLQ